MNRKGTEMTWQFALAYFSIGLLMVGFVQTYDRWQWGSWYWERGDVTPAIIAFNVLASLCWPIGVVVAAVAIPFCVVCALVDGLCAFFEMPFWHKPIIKKRARVLR